MKRVRFTGPTCRFPPPLPKKGRLPFTESSLLFGGKTNVPTSINRRYAQKRAAVDVVVMVILFIAKTLLDIRITEEDTVANFLPTY